MARVGQDSHRLQIFRIMKDCPQGVTTELLRKKVFGDRNSGELGVILRGEVRCRRFTFDDMELGSKEVRYFFLTKLGRKALKEGTVDSDCAKLHLVALGRTLERDIPVEYPV